ncbi:haloacid dehalogenase-like hydrolase [Rhizobium sp. BK376]|nr:haloacid dehalogenase-like hydrolase [Rhizobium sp. BK376]
MTGGVFAPPVFFQAASEMRIHPPAKGTMMPEFTEILRLVRSAAFGIVASLLFLASAQAQSDPLPSWNDTAPKATIVAFVEKVTKQGSPEFVPEPERIAVFDNDGTLWVEHPMYTQLAFVLDRIKTLAPMHPEWKDTQPFKAAIEGDMKTLGTLGEKGVVQLVMATHAGMTTTNFEKIVTDWLAAARDPKFNRPYTKLVYQPMLELLSYLRANGFKTFIVSGGGVEFMRPWTEQVYGIPPEQVVGSSIKTQFKMQDDTPTLYRLPEVNFVDDGAGKPVGINEYIGHRPIAAFGNSDGDLEMLQWTTMGGAPARLGMLIHHTDADREYAYDRDTDFGRLDKALNAAPIANWTVVDMKADWKQIFPPN